MFIIITAYLQSKEEVLLWNANETDQSSGLKTAKFRDKNTFTGTVLTAKRYFFPIAPAVLGFMAKSMWLRLQILISSKTYS